MKRNYWVTYGQFLLLHALGGSVAEWLACWTQTQTGLGLNRCRVTVLHRTVHTHRASVHQAAKLVAALLRVARVTAGLAESNGSLPPGLWLTSPAGWLPRTGISSGTLRSVIEYGLHFFRSRKWTSCRRLDRVARSWSASDWHCNQAHDTCTLCMHCSWRKTFWTCIVNITHACWNAANYYLRKKWWSNSFHKLYIPNFKFYKVV